jgi:aspartate kinase
LKVFKFGGSSVKDAAAMKKVSLILEKDPSCSVVIISATKNTTNELEQIASSAKNCFEEATELWEKTLKRHHFIVNELDISCSFKELDNEVLSLIKIISKLRIVTNEVMDQLYSIGERLSSLILSSYLTKVSKKKVILKDTREVIITDNEFSRANPICSEIKDRVWKVRSDELIVGQGFIGKTLDGRTTTLGREGSDFSATLLAEALGFDEVIIWTDVCGVATMDPRILESAKYIDSMSYSQAGLLAHLGAKVLFERTLEPASRCHFRVIVKSTSEPDILGTIISSNKNPLNLLAMTNAKDTISIVGNDIDPSKLFLNSNFEYQVVEHTREYISIKVSKTLEPEDLNHIHSQILRCHQNV